MRTYQLSKMKKSIKQLNKEIKILLILKMLIEKARDIETLDLISELRELTIK